MMTKIEKNNGGWIYAFIILQIFCSAALILPTFDEYRLTLRITVYGLNLVFLLLIAFKPKYTRLHPSGKFLFVMLAALLFSLFISDKADVLSGIAQIGMYIAIPASLFWVTRLKLGTRTLRNLIWILFIFHSISIYLAILQVYLPDIFGIRPSYILEEGYLQSLLIQLIDGRKVFRPMGLSNSPGGASASGFYVITCGLALLCIIGKGQNLIKRLSKHAIIILNIIVALAVIYLCQVRAMLVASGLTFLIFGILLVRMGHFSKFTRIVLYVIIAITTSFTWAVAMGGKTVIDRLSTLIAAKPLEVYQLNRGFFLQETFTNLIRKYPFGAGPGRWGMVARYFNVKNSFWAEIEWTSWFYDGGVLLALTYVFMLSLTLLVALKILSKKSPECPFELRIWAGFIFAYDVTMISLTFVGHPFNSQSGIEFWLINAVFYGAYYSQQVSIKKFQ